MLTLQGYPVPNDLHNVAESRTTAPDDSGITSPADLSQTTPDGTWGERDVGAPLDLVRSMADYEALRHELSRLSVSRSRPSTGVRRLSSSARLGLTKTITSRSRRPIGRAESQATIDSEGVEDVTGEEPGEEEEFNVGEFLRDGHFEKRTEAGDSAKRVGVVYKNLTVKGVGVSLAFTKTLPQAIVGTFGPDLYHLLCRFVPILQIGRKQPTRDLIHDFSGVVRDGEMMLVLGRPGSGCTTFLKAIANDRSSYAAVTGEVMYGGISAEEQRKNFRGEVNYNPEDDQHFPALTVWQTLKFALMNKTKQHDAGSIPIIIEALLKIFGISHTKDTLVGNEYVRGVSGGERKRVGIAETLATKSTVVCWDNSTRGLDASTALDYAKSLRVMTDV